VSDGDGNDKTAMTRRFNGLKGFLRGLAKKESVSPRAPHEESDEYRVEKERRRGMPGPT
jgi:hypothetical protein